MTDHSASPRRPFSAIAGHPALDLVNTVHWRLSHTRYDDLLREYNDVVVWAEQFEVIDGAVARALRQRAQEHPEEAKRELARVKRLRDQLYDATFGHTSSSVAGTAVAAEYADALRHGRLASDDDSVPARGRWSWRFDPDLTLPRRRLSMLAIDALTSLDAAALGQCADDECGWVFVDDSPRRNRVWCVSADCGNRNRVRRHNERMRRASGDRPTDD